MHTRTHTRTRTRTHTHLPSLAWQHHGRKVAWGWTSGSHTAKGVGVPHPCFTWVSCPHQQDDGHERKGKCRVQHCIFYIVLSLFVVGYIIIFFFNFLFYLFFSLFFQKSSPSEGFASPEYGVIYVAQEYPRWQHVTLTILSGLYNEVRGRREVRT